MASPEERAFLETSRLCIVGLGRASRPPHLSPVYYAMDGDDIVISTTASRFKTKAIERNSAVSLCVIGEQFPFPYVVVYGTGAIEHEGVVDTMMRIGARMTGQPVPEAARPAVEKRAQDEGRVVLRVKPERIVRGAHPLTPAKQH